MIPMVAMLFICAAVLIPAFQAPLILKFTVVCLIFAGMLFFFFAYFSDLITYTVSDNALYIRRNILIRKIKYDKIEKVTENEEDGIFEIERKNGRKTKLPLPIDKDGFMEEFNKRLGGK